jgi:cytochrome d ubiquinol oxidase subunit II
VLFGVALGNVVRGAPLTREGSFHLTFFTNVFHTRGTVGLLDWYTLSMASFCVLMLAAHGATYLVMKTEGEVHRRADGIARSLWVASIPAFGLISLLTGVLRPELLHGLIHRRAFLGSTFLLFGLLMTGAVVLFPVLLFSTEKAEDQLTAFDCAAPAHSLWIATVWWFSALALAFIYLFVIQRYYAGKVNVSKDNQGLY